MSALRRQFGGVWIPPAVVDELKVDANLPGTDQINQALKEGWLSVIELESFQLSQVLERDLDRGESHAIALALESNMDMILIDEHEGREAAKTVGLAPIGILGVLLREKREGRLTSLAEIMRDLREKAGFYVAESLYNQLLSAAGES